MSFIFFRIYRRLFAFSSLYIIATRLYSCPCFQPKLHYPNLCRIYHSRNDIGTRNVSSVRPVVPHWLIGRSRLKRSNCTVLIAMTNVSLLDVTGAKVFSRPVCVNTNIGDNSGMRSASFVLNANNPSVRRVLFLEKIRWSVSHATKLSMRNAVPSVPKLSAVVV